MPTTLKLDKFLPYRLSIASNAVSDAVATAYRTLFGLRIPEWRLVAVLAEDGALSQQALCGRTRMDKVTVSRAAIALADRRLVARAPNPEDQRSHLLTLTPEGWALYEQVAPKALELERRVFEGIAPEEIEAFRAMLARLEAAAGALGPSPPVGEGGS
ncbi:MAG: MarR family winged helix-turn-helix transcriptional regulator [Pseudomonadota bacterium]